MTASPTTRIPRATCPETRVMVVDDHPVVRQGLAALVNSEPDLKIVGEAGGVLEASQCLDQWRPHVVLVDLNLGDSDGIELLSFITRHWVGVRAIVVSQYPALQYADRARRAGAVGYINKSVAPGVICEAVRVVRLGGVYFDPGLHTE